MQRIGSVSLVPNSDTTSNSLSLKRPASPERLNGLKIALAKMALLRDDTMDAVKLESFSKALADEFADDADVIVVMDRLVRSPRAEFEPKVPAMGDFLQMVRDCRAVRIRKEREAWVDMVSAAESEDRERFPKDWTTPHQFWTEANAIVARKTA